tara:strand:- start:23 stop:898 length:876 start_codon:yes stop_codon:yes gene_type:complete
MLVVFDNDGMVRKQNLHAEYDVQFIKCRDLEDDIKFDFDSWDDVEKLKQCSNSKEWYNPDNFNISLIGSGSYHHLSLFILEQRTKPFYLVMFDWHYDAGMSRFKWQRDKKRQMAKEGKIEINGGGNRYAFGGWVIAASLLPTCKGILLVGMGESEWEKKSSLGPTPKESWNIDVIEETKDYHTFPDKIKDIIPDDTDVYVTVCKDVLNKHEVLTDWNNGEMTVNQLMYMLGVVRDNYNICGVDICGEKAKKGFWGDDDEFEFNNKVSHYLLNKQIIDFFGGKELYGKKTNI